MSSSSAHGYVVNGAGLGFRRAFYGKVEPPAPSPVSFMEVAPENWIDIGGAQGRWFRSWAQAHPFVCHGLSLDLGGLRPLNEGFVRQVGGFMKEHGMLLYSEHLSYCADERGYLYDLLPIPFTAKAVKHVAGRIQRVQDLIGQRMAVENVSYYVAPDQSHEMSELDFLLEVLKEADCKLLLDVNNVYVNSINHRYDPVSFLQCLPSERIAYAHIAGHREFSEDIRVDSHGADVCDPVWDLLDKAYDLFGPFPTVLERDANIPPWPELIKETGIIDRLQKKHAPKGDREAAKAVSFSAASADLRQSGVSVA